MSSNISVSYCVKISQYPTKFKGEWVVSPAIAMLYLWQLISLFNKYKKKCKPIVIHELCFLGDIFCALITGFLISLGSQETWVCTFLQMLFVMAAWCGVADFIGAQVDTFLFVRHGSEYKKKMDIRTASKMAHINKIVIPFAVAIMAHGYNEYFKCQPYDQIFSFRIENLIILGIPYTTAAIITIIVSIYTSIKIFKKINSAAPGAPTNQSVKYKVDDERVFIDVTSAIPTVSQQATTNVGDIQIEDIEQNFENEFNGSQAGADGISERVIEEVEEGKSEIARNNPINYRVNKRTNNFSSPIQELSVKALRKKDENKSFQNDVIPEELIETIENVVGSAEILETVEEVDTEIERNNSMYHRVNKRTTTVLCVPVQELTVEAMKAIFKVTLMSVCSVTMIASLTVTTLYLYIVTSPDCSDYNNTIRRFSSVVHVTSVVMYPLFVRQKLAELHSLKDFSKLKFSLNFESSQ